MAGHSLLIMAVIAALLLSCAGLEPESADLTIAIIGKSIHPYWRHVEKGVVDGVIDAGVDLIRQANLMF